MERNDVAVKIASRIVSYRIVFNSPMVRYWQCMPCWKLAELTSVCSCRDEEKTVVTKCVRTWYPNGDCWRHSVNQRDKTQQEVQLSPRDRAMRRVSWNLANCHATVQKLLVRQVLNKWKLWSWRVTVGRCVINTCTQQWRGRVASIVL